MNASEIHSRAAALPALPVVIAQSMLIAQGFKLTGTDRESVKARCDFLREVGLPPFVRLTVKDVRGAVLGDLTYSI